VRVLLALLVTAATAGIASASTADRVVISPPGQGR